MSEMYPKGLVMLLGAAMAIGFVLLWRPAYLSDYTALGAVLGAELLLLAVVKYRTVFFPILIAVFLCAGIGLPFQSVFLYARWILLGTGAAVGVVVYVRLRNHFLGTFHLLALFCSLSAVISASVSAYPNESLLKALSLALLFLYAATGARAALPDFQPELFFRKLLIGCEALVIITAISYFVFRWEFLGNPNSLGAVMGVAVVPVLLWGLITADRVMRRRRLGFELLIAILLLMSSFARAGILAAAVSSFALCVALKQYRLLIKGAAAAIAVALVAAMFAPRTSDMPQRNASEPIADVFLYKGHAAAGVLGSRRGVWEQTWGIIKKNPWFGSGFGTSAMTGNMNKLGFGTRHIDSWVVREHGNSYLAITEWVGLFGVLPFFSLVLLSFNNVRTVFSWVRRTGDAVSPAVPAAAVVAAGLVHAAFEDWIFAVGYYLCVFFWVMAFILVDVLPGRAAAYLPTEVIQIPEPQFDPIASAV